MGEVSLVERALRWEGCHNVRDLGGLETAAQGRTRHGGVVRADNVRRLTPAGWEDARRHNVVRLVDLRFEDEATEEPAPPDGIDVVSVSLFGAYDPEVARAFDAMVRAADDVAPVLAAGYVKALEARPERVAVAVAAIADADPDGAVVVHCFAGKYRTGIVSALLLTLADVPDETVAAD